MTILKKENFIILMVGIIFFLPILTINVDLWDGVVLAHAFDTSNSGIYWNWFTESGWVLVPLLYDFFSFVSSGHEYIAYVSIVMVLFHILSAYEIKKLSSIIFGFSRFESTFCSVLFLISPVWVLYHSSVFLMHSVTIFLALFSARKIIEGKHLAFYFILSFLSFQQSSNPALIITIIFAFNMVKKRFTLDDNKVLISYVVFAIASFFLYRYFFPAHGLYAGYNKLSFEKLLNFDSYVKFSDFLFYLNSLAIVTSVIVLVKTKSKQFFFISMLLLLVAAVNTIPYIMVGKLPLIKDMTTMQGYSQRFAFNAIIPMVLLSGVVLSQLKPYTAARNVLAIAILAQTIIFNIQSQESKIKVAIYQTEFIQELRKITELPSCVVRVDYGKNYIPSFYEMNYFFYTAFGQINQLPVYSFKTNYEKVDARKILKEPIYRDKYIMPSSYPDCEVKLSVRDNLRQLTVYEMLSWIVSANSLEKQIVNITN